MDFFSKFKELFKNKDRKKVIENTAIVIIIGIIILIAGNTLFSKNSEKSGIGTDVNSGGGSGSGSGQGLGSGSNTGLNSGASTGYQTFDSNTDEENRMKQELQDILKKMQGVGDADVMITFESGTENIPAYDTDENESTTSEKDGDGGTRSTIQKENASSIVFGDDQNGAKTPVILKEIKPVVKAVLVVAEGAGEPEVKGRIFNSIQTLFDIPVSRIQVVEMKK